MSSMELKSQLIEYAIPEEKVSRLHNASYHHQKPSFDSFMYFKNWISLFWSIVFV